MLARDGAQLGRRGVESLGILDRVAHADVEHDLQEPRNLVHVLEAELLLQLGAHALLVEVEQPCPGRRLRRRAFGLGLGSGGLLALPTLAALLSLLALLALGLLGLLLFPLRHGRGVRRFWLLLVVRLFLVRHRYLTRGIGWP